jgi:3',5'-cyclic AMP phosphodiesterase CpdA
MKRALLGCLCVVLLFGSVWAVQYTDYNFVILSDTHIGATNSTRLLTSAVKKINSLVASKNIKFVFITGDLTNSATTSQYAEVRTLLDNLIIPYYPIIGNHDIWPYNSTWENDLPTGDQLFWDTFKDKYAGLLHTNVTVWNPENKCNSFFQNLTAYLSRISR